jgi:hypothetical protein
MESIPTIKMTPVAPTGSQIISGNQRMTILTDGLLRLETTQDGKFEDRASTFAINRELPTPKFDLTKRDDGSMEIVTDRLFIQWTGEAFGPTSLMVTLRRKGELWFRASLIQACSSCRGSKKNQVKRDRFIWRAETPQAGA